MELAISKIRPKKIKNTGIAEHPTSLASGTIFSTEMNSFHVAKLDRLNWPTVSWRKGKEILENAEIGSIGKAAKQIDKQTERQYKKTHWQMDSIRRQTDKDTGSSVCMTGKPTNISLCIKHAKKDETTVTSKQNIRIKS
jgi:hypothetical protein